ncbi:hypothetical protein C0J52_19145 [Blattella germanica]|nr:hypothetical protein C0J52_19145 [Blattella germanica]
MRCKLERGKREWARNLGGKGWRLSHHCRMLPVSTWGECSSAENSERFHCLFSQKEMYPFSIAADILPNPTYSPDLELTAQQTDVGQGLPSGCRHRTELTGCSIVSTKLIPTADNPASRPANGLKSTAFLWCLKMNTWKQRTVTSGQETKRVASILVDVLKLQHTTFEIHIIRVGDEYGWYENQHCNCTSTENSRRIDQIMTNQARKKDKKSDISETLKLATWNVRGLTNKESELEKELSNLKIDIAAITETKKKLQGSLELQNYLMIYGGVKQEQRASAGVAIWIHKRLKNRIHSYTFINERIIMLRIKIDRGYVSILSLYAPEEGKTQNTIEFYNELQKIINKLNKNDNILLLGDLNGRVGKNPIKDIVGTEVSLMSGKGLSPITKTSKTGCLKSRRVKNSTASYYSSGNYFTCVTRFGHLCCKFSEKRSIRVMVLLRRQGESTIYISTTFWKPLQYFETTKIQRIQADRLPKNVLEWIPPEKHRKGRPTITRKKNVKDSVEILQLGEKQSLDREAWKRSH